MSHYDRLRQALQKLETQFAQYRKSGIHQTAMVQEAMVGAVIDRFQLSYDQSWKALQHYLAAELKLADVPHSPRAIFQLAAEHNLLLSPAEQWFRYLSGRVGTSHDPEGEQARACLTWMDAFLADATGLHQTLSGQPWQADG